MWLAQSVRVAIGMYLGVWLLLFGGCATGTAGAGPPPLPPLVVQWGGVVYGPCCGGCGLPYPCGSHGMYLGVMLSFSCCATGTAGAPPASCPLLCGEGWGRFVALAVAAVACPARTGRRRHCDV